MSKRDFYEVLGLKSSAPDPLASTHPMIGRESEWNEVRSIARRSAAGQTLVLSICGDVGLGKSRLLAELVREWNTEYGASSNVRCPSFGRHAPYLPWLPILRELIGLHSDASGPERLEQIGHALHDLDPTLTYRAGLDLATWDDILQLKEITE